MNDTQLPITVTHLGLTTVYAGRLEVRPVSSPGDFAVKAAAGDFSGGSTIFDTTPTPLGTGFNILPGAYTLTMTYQGQSIVQDLVIRNQP
jgi:hypothetical protein